MDTTNLRAGWLRNATVGAVYDRPICSFETDDHYPKQERHDGGGSAGQRRGRVLVPTIDCTGRGEFKYQHVQSGKREQRHLRTEEKIVIIHVGIRNEHQHPRGGSPTEGRPGPPQDIGGNPRKRPPDGRNPEQAEIDDDSSAKDHGQPEDVEGFDQRKQVKRIPNSGSQLR